MPAVHALGQICSPLELRVSGVNASRALGSGSNRDTTARYDAATFPRRVLLAHALSDDRQPAAAHLKAAWPASGCGNSQAGDHRD